jgi:hypothetical protein
MYHTACTQQPCMQEKTGRGKSSSHPSGHATAGTGKKKERQEHATTSAGGTHASDCAEQKPTRVS